MSDSTIEVLNRLNLMALRHRSFLESQSDSHRGFLKNCHTVVEAAGAAAPEVSQSFRINDFEHLIALATDPWLIDHRPNWTLPALPMMSMVDKIAKAAADHAQADVVAIRQVRLIRWLLVDDEARVRISVKPAPGGLEVDLWAWRTAATAKLSRFEHVVTATVELGRPFAPSAPFAPLTDAVEQPNPYASGMLFHGPSFHYLTQWFLSPCGASGVLDAGQGNVPRGLLNQGLLDGALHVIPAQSMWHWSPDIQNDVVGIPHRLDWMECYEPLPDTGEVRVEARFAGFDDGAINLPIVRFQLLVADRVVTAFQIALGLPSLGKLANATPADRRAFLANREYVPGVGLSTHAGSITTLAAEAVAEIDWPPGAVANIYGLPAQTVDRVAVIAAKEHLASRLAVHPASVIIADDLRTGWMAGKPEELHRIAIDWVGDEVRVSSGESVPT